MKKLKNKIVISILSIIILSIYTLYMNYDKKNVTQQANNINDLNSYGNLKIYFLDVGQADSILVIDKDMTMLIDAGNNDDGKKIVNFIKSLNIKNIDYVIGTHPHEDHIGGLDDVINSFDIGKIYMPEVYTNTKTFEDVLDSIKNKGLSITKPVKGDSFKLENANCTIMSCEKNQENLNVSSIVIRMKYLNESYLFMGDAENENEKSINWEKTNVLKVGHHGSTSSTTNNFLKQILPEVAIISVGKDNDYGHPNEEVLKRLNKNNVEIYRTDLDGTIMIESDGNTNKITKIKNMEV